MPDLPEWAKFVFSSIMQEFIATLASIGVAIFIRNTWIKWRYGGWEVIVKKDGKDVVHREVSPSKIKMVQDEVADLSVFLKGVASPYEQINIDLVSEESKKRGLLIEDYVNKHYIVDLDENPIKGKPEANMRL